MWVVNNSLCTCIYTYTHVRVNTYACTHACTSTYTHTYTHTHTHTQHTYTHTHIYIPSFVDKSNFKEPDTLTYFQHTPDLKIDLLQRIIAITKLFQRIANIVHLIFTTTVLVIIILNAIIMQPVPHYKCPHGLSMAICHRHQMICFV